MIIGAKIRKAFSDAASVEVRERDTISRSDYRTTQGARFWTIAEGYEHEGRTPAYSLADMVETEIRRRGDDVARTLRRLGLI
jgi:hypothetical protein